MSVDKMVIDDLMELLKDSEDGLVDAAEKLADSGRSDLAATFGAFAAQRTRFYSELETFATAYGNDLDESGTLGCDEDRCGFLNWRPTTLATTAGRSVRSPLG